MSECRLKLYVSGRGYSAQRAIDNARRLADERLAGACELTVVDVYEYPEVAEAARILATPTLVREQPLPERRVLGDLSQPERVILGLDLETND